VPIVSGGTTTCYFENNGQGVLKIVSETIGGDGTEVFNYDIDKYKPGSPSVTSSSLLVSVDEEIRKDPLWGDEFRGSDEIELDKAETAYTITTYVTTSSSSPSSTSTSTEEGVPEGWALSSVVCELEDGTNIGVDTIYSYGIENVTIQGGGRVTTCTFTNTKKGELKIEKKEAIASSSPTSPTPPPPPPSSTGGIKFDYDINFIDSDYLDLNVLPFALDPTDCGDGTCEKDEDCNICDADCGVCNPPVPSPGVAASPSRMTVEINKDDTKRFYPGFYNLIEYLKTTPVTPPPPPPPGTPPPPPDDKVWTVKDVECVVKTIDPTTTGGTIDYSTGTVTGRGATDVGIFAGKPTVCTVTNELVKPREGGGGRGSDPQEPEKPTQQPIY
jgi:hypothetical protein